ncbi:MAG: hypothetical protein IPM42_01830 [Saprospiraceae bacterium]|nr:hypothetical protein [Saprospiraceae bacterium]
MNDSFESIYRELSINSETHFSEDDFLDFIAEKVSYYLEADHDLLLSYLYRLDINEQKVSKALELSEEDPPHVGIAKLILERQKQRMATKLKYRQDPISGWEF